MKLAAVGVAVVLAVLVAEHCDVTCELQFEPDSPLIAVAVVSEEVAAAWAAANAEAFSGNICFLGEIVLILFLLIVKRELLESEIWNRSEIKSNNLLAHRHTRDWLVGLAQFCRTN